MAFLSEDFARACVDVDEAQELLHSAISPEGIDPVKLRMAARKLTTAARLLEGKARPRAG